jgi:hypothetical protein
MIAIEENHPKKIMKLFPKPQYETSIVMKRVRGEEILYLLKFWKK